MRDARIDVLDLLRPRSPSWEKPASEIFLMVSKAFHAAGLVDDDELSPAALK